MSKFQPHSIASPLNRARGLGSAKSGTHHWWLQRVTAIALVPLSVWFLVGLITTASDGREAAAAWISTPYVSLLMVALLLALFLHLKLGLQVIIEDYVHRESNKIALLLFKDALVVLGVIASLMAVLKLTLYGI
jgi:succinate dehydrogenase / fumarate reductase membrane anchor subunit